MGAGEGTAPLKLLGCVFTPLAALGMVEVFVLAPAVAWSDPRIWLVVFLGTGMLVLLVWLAALAIDWGLSVLGRKRPSGSDVALWLVTIIVGVGESWELFGSRLPVSGKLLTLLVLIVVLSICYVAIRVFGGRLRKEPKGLGVGFAAVLAGLIFFQAVRRNLFWSGTYASGQPLVLGFVGLYAVVGLVVLLWGGARSAVCAGVLLLLGVVLVRVSTTNEFELHVMEKADSFRHLVRRYF